MIGSTQEHPEQGRQRACALLLALLLAGPLAWAGSSDAAPGRAAHPAKPPRYNTLVDEPSRADLFTAMLGPQGVDEEGRGHFALTTPFKFPGDTRMDGSEARTASLFGIDISHYTGDDFRLDSLADKNVLFVYVKASDGLRGKNQQLSIDPKFQHFWNGLGALEGDARVYRGAYHFLRADVPAAAQAQVLLDQLQAGGGLQASDLPPVLDLEPDYRCVAKAQPGHKPVKTCAYASAHGKVWQPQHAGGTLYDFWKDRKPADILALVSAAAQAVSAGTGGRTPLVYTSNAWWKAAIGKDIPFERIAGVKLWIADYGSSDPSQPTGSLHDEQPRVPTGARWTLWQFTEQAGFATGYAGKLDANIFKGSPEDFLAALEVSPFP